MSVVAGFDPGRVLQILKLRDYRIYSIGNVLSLTGSWGQRLAAGWLAWELTQSPSFLGLVVFADLCPMVVVGLYSGVMADRMDKLRIVRNCQAAGAVLALILTGLAFAGLLGKEALLAITFGLGLADAIAQPARLALVPVLVGREHLGSGVAFGAVIFNLARFAGPLAGGLCIAHLGVAYAFLLNALSFLAMLTCIALLRVETAPTRRDHGSVMGEIREGLAHIARSPMIRSLFLILLSAGMLARPMAELLPGLAATLYGASPVQLSMMTAALALGALAGGVLLVSLTAHTRLLRVVQASVLLLAATEALVTLSGSYALSLALFTLFGLFNIGTFIATQTLLQLHGEERMRGRLLSTYGMITRGAPALGSLLLGALADMLGFRIALCGAAILLGLAVLPLFRHLRFSG